MDAMRYELKYLLPVSLIPEISQFIRPHVQHDPYCAGRPGHCYTVRSLYFDSADLCFYFEKHDGVRVRRKLRVRTYNEPDPAAAVFIEIKRKFGRRGCKERVCLPLQNVGDVLQGAALCETVAEGPSGKNGNGNGSHPCLDPARVVRHQARAQRRRDRIVLAKVGQLMSAKKLRPAVLVAYEREAFIGQRDQRLRVTFDQNIRSLIDPSLAEIYHDRGLHQFESRNYVLELKFDNRMPRWMALLIRRLNLVARPYSKYCNGIDAWAQRVPQRDQDQQEEDRPPDTVESFLAKKQEKSPENDQRAREKLLGYG